MTSPESDRRVATALTANPATKEASQFGKLARFLMGNDGSYGDFKNFEWSLAVCP